MHLNLINELHKILSTRGLIENKKIRADDVPEIYSNIFHNDNNENNKFNQRTLGIILYSLKISLTTFTFDDREKYFYSYLVMTDNSSEDIINILDNSYIPGYDLDIKGLSKQSKDIDEYILGSGLESIFGYEGDTDIIINLTLKFVLFSNLFFDILNKKLKDKDIYNYSIDGNYSCLRMIFLIWNTLEKNLTEYETPIIEIYFNLIIKYLPNILKQCSLETIKSRDSTEKFQEKFGKFIIACLDNYKEYSLNYIDTKMKYIIQEQNNPLKYNFGEFPFLTYYSLQKKPNRDDIINKIGNNKNYLILNNFFNSIVEDNGKIITDFNISNLGKFFVKSINDDLMIIINRIEKYKKLYKLFKLQYGSIKSISIIEKIGSMKEIEEKLQKLIIGINNMTESLIGDKIKYDSSYKYLYNEIYEEKELFSCSDFEIIDLNLRKISKYKHYSYIFSNYMYRNNFKNNLTVDYFNYKNFDIDLTELDEHLFSILLYNKKIILDIDYSKKFYIPRFDLFNKVTNNQNFLKNYLFEYKAREELDMDQIRNMNNLILKIVEKDNSDIIEKKRKFENQLKEKIDNIKNEIKEKRGKLNENIEQNLKKEEIEFIKYDRLLEIKNLEKEIDKNEYIIDMLNYKYKILISSLKANYLIDICFSLQNLLYYIYTLNINEEIPLISICKNLQLFKFNKDKLISLLENNNNIKLSQLFSLYEYFEFLILPEFIYHINKGYMSHIPIHLSQKLLYMFEKDEFKNNIIFTKKDLIEAIRKCLCRYIASSTIDKDYITEDLNMDLLELLLKEDLWNKNIKMSELKESFNYINNYLEFPIKVKHIFNLFEILIGIDKKNYLSMDIFQEEEKEEDNNFLEFIEEKKEEKKEENEIELNEPEINSKGNEENDLFEEDDSNLERSCDKSYMGGLEKLLDIRKRRKIYIYDFLKRSQLPIKNIDNIDPKENNEISKEDSSIKDLIREVINFGSIINNRKLVEKFDKFIKKPKINIKLSKLKQKKDIINIGDGVSDIIFFDKNKIIVSYYYERIKLFSFDKKTFREETIIKPVDIVNLNDIKNLEEIYCMKELIDGTVLLGTKRGYILNIQFNEIKKDNKIEYNIKLLNQAQLEEKKRIYDLIEINSNMFISHDENENNVLWRDFKIQMNLKKGKITKIKNYLIILDDVITFYDIKKNFEETGTIKEKFQNYAIIDEKYIIGEKSNWEKNKVHLINIEKKRK